jgi:2-polyprenyl-3-methyl-5-hydroxy-6-metoxy-1,4-benzoquinol methylase
MTTDTIDQARFEALFGTVFTHVAGAVSVLMAYMGDRLGLYAALREVSPATSAQVAAKAGLDERYVREWLSANAAAGYADWDGARFSLSPEAALIFAAEGDPRCMQGFFQILKSMYDDEEKSTAAIRENRGLPWSGRSPCCFCGTDRFFRPGYATNLIASWIPALSGVEDRLRAGGRAADIGCGHGSSTLLMAEAFPAATFVGFDFHAPSIAEAREKARAAGLANVSFEVAAAKDFGGEDYDLVCIFDALHDMGDPVGAARHVLETLAPDGTWMIVEPAAGDAVEDNLNPIGRAYYGFSTLLCTPASLSQEVGLALGAQAGEARLREVVTAAGFTRFRRAAETPFNIVLEARP